MKYNTARAGKVRDARGEAENAGEKNSLPQSLVFLNYAPKTFGINLI